MNEYKDQLVWFELFGWDGTAWCFLDDFDTREDALLGMDESSVLGIYDAYDIIRVSGIA